MNASAPLFAVAPIERTTVDPTRMPLEVLHYSIPTLEMTGAPARETSDSIGSIKLRLFGGEILISRLNPRKSRVVQVPSAVAEFSVASTEFVAARPGPLLAPRFLYYYLGSSMVAEFLDSQVRSVTRSHQRVEPEAISNLQVPLPALDVQRRIADFLDDQVSSLDRIAALRRREQHLLEMRQRSSLADLVSKHQTDWVPLRRFLRPRQEPDRADLQVLSVYRDHGVIPKNSRSDNFNKTPEDLARYQRVAPNDLVVNKMKAWSGSVAVSRFEGIVSPDYLVCEVLDGLDPWYLHLVLRSPFFVAEMGIRSRGIRPNQERLYWEDLGGIEVPAPSIQDQQRTVDAAATTMATIDSIRGVFGRVNDLLEERKRSLITAAVTGEFNVAAASSRAANAAVSGVGGVS